MRKPLLYLLLALFGSPVIAEASSTVVISQVYGGGGNSGSTLKNDFVELFNRSTASVSVTGWTVQYAASGGSSWDRITLSGSIGPGRYYLIAAGGSTGGTVNLPASDASGSINLSATSGKVALVTSSSLLSGTCPTSGIADFVGYGSASCAEGTAASALTNTTASIRIRNGCADDNINSADFSTGSPSPRNSVTSATVCTGIDTLPLFLLFPLSPALRPLLR